MWISGHLDYSEPSNILPGAVKGERIAKRQEKCNTFGNLLDKVLENLEDHSSPKVQDLVDEEI